MRQHIINGMQINGNMGNIPMVAGAARDVRTLHLRSEKRLSKVGPSGSPSVPSSSVVRETLQGYPRLRQGTPATAWPAAAFEPPAAAWAALVINRAISV